MRKCFQIHNSRAYKLQAEDSGTSVVVASLKTAWGPPAISTAVMQELCLCDSRLETAERDSRGGEALVLTQSPSSLQAKVRLTQSWLQTTRILEGLRVWFPPGSPPASVDARKKGKGEVRHGRLQPVAGKGLRASLGGFPSGGLPSSPTAAPEKG